MSAQESDDGAHSHNGNNISGGSGSLYSLLRVLHKAGAASWSSATMSSSTRGTQACRTPGSLQRDRRALSAKITNQSPGLIDHGRVTMIVPRRSDAPSRTVIPRGYSLERRSKLIAVRQAHLELLLILYITVSMPMQAFFSSD